MDNSLAEREDNFIRDYGCAVPVRNRNVICEVPFIPVNIVVPVRNKFMIHEVPLTIHLHGFEVPVG